MLISKTWVEISKPNLLHNVGQFLKVLKPETQFMAVVKANAYGHGLAEATQIIHESMTNSSRIWFGVDNLDEAAAVREIAPRSPVLVLGYTPNARLHEAAKLGARLTIYNWETVQALQKLFGVASESSRRRNLSVATPLRVHVKIETGTTRQGIAESEVVEYVKALKKLRGVMVEGISTHFADSEDTGSDYAIRQLTRYNSVIKRLHGAGLDVPVHHTACTAATLRFPQTHGNLVRVGIGLYGLWPSEAIRQILSFPRTRESTIVDPRSCLSADRSRSGMTDIGITLKPVLTWKTIVAQVKEIKKGTPVSYDRTEYVKRNSRVAVLPVGYSDGYDRGLSGIGHVLINGTRCKVLGRICMNMCIVDITDAGHVKPEDEVVLIGTQRIAPPPNPLRWPSEGEASWRSKVRHISADEMAKQLGTIHYEVVTRINFQLPRKIVQR